METAASILKELEKLGTEQTRKTFRNHGANENMFGVKVGDMKPIAKRLKKQYQLALDLYDTGNSDAMYLAGLIGDETKFKKADLNNWAKKATWHMISEYTVPFIAAESPLGWECALTWINAKEAHVASAGWSTLSSIISTLPNEEIDKQVIKTLLKRVQKEIHEQANRVRYTMNGFVISVGSYLPDLTELAKQTASKIGKVEVNVGNTACKVPDALSYISKVESMNQLGKKRKTARC